MTEARWLTLVHAKPMLNFLRGKVSDRKLRLFACACWQEWEPIRDNPGALAALGIMEQYADGLLPRPSYTPNRRNSIEAMVLAIRSGHAHSAACKVNQSVGHREYAWIIRDIFGNPFRPVAFAPDWRTDTAVSLARGMYESRDFGAMPILADALQDAGCDNTDILAHCRGAGPHVRGCWVLDLLLGKN